MDPDAPKKEQPSAFHNIALEIYKTFNNLILFYGFLRFAVVFLFAFLILSFFNTNWMYAFIPGLIYFGWYVYSKSRFNKVKVIEAHYEALNEKLSTAIDNDDEKNFFVAELHDEVKQGMKIVNTSEFFNTRRLMTDLASVVILSLLIVAVARFNINISRFEAAQEIFGEIASLASDAVTDLAKKQADGTGGEEGAGEEGAFDDIFGEKTVIDLGNTQMELTLAPGEEEIDINQEKDEKDLEFEQSYPEEVGGEAESSYEDRIPKEQQEIVKQYYKNIART